MAAIGGVVLYHTWHDKSSLEIHFNFRNLFHYLCSKGKSTEDKSETSGDILNCVISGSATSVIFSEETLTSCRNGESKGKGSCDLSP
ncbi:hypothetical protein H5410_008295 [Solanum commersonii]|uniref:Uncharacterized protein n=1 Tax=Solanum commersonii TaxID=4109 RepID=A0A9J6AEJ4_SOLCO|nr:hypothetical protein H5410_008295 [Solanum commersonii]